MKLHYHLMHSFHCVAHRLQHVVLDSIIVTPYFLEVEDVLRSIYAHYSRSPKNTGELRAIMDEMELDFLTPKSVLKVRWVMSKVKALEAIIRDYPALLADLSNRANNAANPKKCARQRKAYFSLFLKTNSLLLYIS